MINFKKLDDNELVNVRIETEKELSYRGIVFSVGEIGEILAIKHFNSTPGLPNLIRAPKGAKNVDALSRDGDRYSIKACLKAKKTGTVYEDRNEPNKRLFEYLLVVGLTQEYSIEYIYRFSWNMFLKARAWDKRMNAWYIPISQKKLLWGEKIYPKVSLSNHRKENRKNNQN